MKKTYSSAFKAQLVQELLKETTTMTQRAAEHGVHPNILRDWKLTTRKGLPSRSRDRSTASQGRRNRELLSISRRQIDRLTAAGELLSIGPGRLRRYALADLRAWQNRNRETS